MTTNNFKAIGAFALRLLLCIIIAVNILAAMFSLVANQYGWLAMCIAEGITVGVILQLYTWPAIRIDWQQVKT